MVVEIQGEGRRSNLVMEETRLIIIILLYKTQYYSSVKSQYVCIYVCISFVILGTYESEIVQCTQGWMV